MKKYVVIIILCLFLSGCTIYNLNNFILPDDKGFIDTINKLDTPYKISLYMQENFIYQTHIVYAPCPYTLWKTKKGDCNDFSSFATFVADYHGYKTYQMDIFNHNISHYLGIYQTGNCYQITSNMDIFWECFKTFEEIANYYNNYDDKYDYTKYKVYDINQNIIEAGTL